MKPSAAVCEIYLPMALCNTSGGGTQNTETGNGGGGDPQLSRAPRRPF